MIRIIVERPEQPPSVRAFPKEEVLVGRAVESDWCLPFPDISRQHCRFTSRSGEFFVEGVSERSPIYVNGRRIHGITRIEARDVVRFGLCSARLGEGVAGDAPRAPRPRPASEQAPASRLGRATPRAAAAGVIGEAPKPVRSADPVSPPAPSPEGPRSSRAGAPGLAGAPGPRVELPRDMSAIAGRAQRWRELDRPPSHLLRGADLRRGREWIRSARGDLGEHGALVRQYVETSQTGRRVGVRRRAFGGALIAGSIVVGFWTASVLAGDLVLPDVGDIIDAASQGCKEGLLARGQESLRSANAVADERLGLLLSLYAYQVAEQSRCPQAAAIERGLRDRLAGQAGRVLGGHAAPVVAAAISPNQHYAASVDEEGVLHLWRLGQRQLPERLDTPAKVQRLAWSQDSRLLIAGDDQGLVTVWTVDRTEVRRERELTGHRSPITSIAVSRSGELMATGDRRGEVRLWMVAGSSLGQQVGEGDGRLGAAHELVFDARGRRLYGRVGAGLVVWSLPTSGQHRLGKPDRLATDQEVTTMDVSLAGDQLLVGDASGQVYLWSVKGGRMNTPLLIHGAMEKIVQVAFVPRDQALVATSERRLFLVNYGVKVRSDDKYATRRFKGTGGVVRQLIVDPSGSRALTVHAEGREIWNLSEVEEEPLVSAGVDGGSWRTVASSGSHSLLIAGGGDGRVILWDLRADKGSGGAHMLTDHGQAVDAVALSNDGATLVSGGRDGVVRIWRVADAAVTPTKTCDVKAPIDRISFHEERIAVAAGERIFVCDAGADRPSPVELSGTYEVVTHLAFSGDGEWLVAADRSGTVVGWQGRSPAADKPSFREGDLGGQVSALAVSREHAAVATFGVSDGSVVIRPLSATSGGTIAYDRELPWTSVAFHDQGGLLAAGSRSGVVRVWKLGSAEPYKKMNHDSSVSALAFSSSPAEAAMVAIGGNDGDLALFDVMTAAPRPLGKRRGSISALSFASPEVVITTVGDSATKLFVDGTADDFVDLVGHTKPITGLAVDGRGRFAATSSMDGSVRVWPLRENGLRWLVCDRVGGDLTQEEWAKYLPGESPVPLCGYS